MVQPTPGQGCSSLVHKALAFPSEEWTRGESCSLDRSVKEEESWKMHMLTAGGWKRNNSSPTLWHLSLFLRGTKESPREAVPGLGCDSVWAQRLLLSTAGCFWPLWWKPSGCTLLHVYEIRLNNMFKKASHMERSHALACLTKIIFEFIKTNQIKFSIIYWK